MRALLGDAPRRSDLLIEHLHKIQDRYGCLSTAHLAALAAEMNLAQAEVFEVATFYHHFDIVREGEAAPPALTVRVCDGLSCEMAGAQELLARLPALLGPACASSRRPASAAASRRRPQSSARTRSRRASCEDVAAAVAAKRTRHEPARLHRPRRLQGRRRLRAAAPVHRRRARRRRSSIKTLEASGLRGLGGAGFPAGRKWRIVRSEPAPRLMAVNIDEGEPGTFKDRVFLERDPHRFIEGMLIAAWAVGISRIYVYLRDEYHGCRAMLEAELAKLRAAPPYPGMPEIVLRRGAGAYICGEESAMIESIEGKRGMPRLRPPYVAQVGLFGRPTLEHNFETLYWVRETPREGRRLVRRRTAAMAGRACARSRSRAACATPASSSRPPASRSWS